MIAAECIHDQRVILELIEVEICVLCKGWHDPRIEQWRYEPDIGDELLEWANSGVEGIDPALYSIMPMNSTKDYKAREVDVAQPLMGAGPVGGNQGGDYLVQVAPEVAAPLSAGSHPESNTPGRHQEDDENLAVVAFSGRPDAGMPESEISHPIDAREKDGARRNQGGTLVVGVGGEISHPLMAEGGDASEDGTGRGTPVIATQEQEPDTFVRSHVRNTTDDGDNWDERDHSLTLAAEPLSGIAGHTLSVSKPALDVRRLTPLECARLQGFPDDWLDGLGLPDTTKYKMLGNAVSVTVARWIFARINMVMGYEPVTEAEGVSHPRGEAVAIPIDMRNAMREDDSTGAGTPGTGVGEDGDSATAVTSVPSSVATGSPLRDFSEEY